MSENYLYGTTPAPTNPTRVLEVKILKALNNAATATGSGVDNLAPGVVDPEGVLTGNPGQTYFNTANSTLWEKATGTGNTGWVQLI